MPTPGLNAAANTLAIELILFCLLILSVVIDGIFIMFYDITKIMVFILMSKLSIFATICNFNIRAVNYTLIFTTFLIFLELTCLDFSRYRSVEFVLMSIATIYNILTS